ncbi:MAG: DoxX family protein [Candidatus Acidiferrales bacterium]|jgi:putative oxidoreductase
MEEHPPHDLFSPLLNSNLLMGPFLLTARLFTTGVFVFYILDELHTTRATGALIYLAMAIQLVGITLVAVGYKTRFAALLLATYSIVTAILFNGTKGWSGLFMTHMLKDLAIASGFLFLFAYGGGPISVDRPPAGGKPAGILGNNVLMGLLLLVGRVMAAVLFLYYGTFKILHTPQMQAYMVKHNSSVPTELIYLAIFTQIVPPALVLLGYKTRYGALALAGFCIIATSLFHAEFGNHAEVEQFLLDFAIAGGLLFMFAYGPGPFSVDARLSRAGSAGKPALVVEKGALSVAR